MRVERLSGDQFTVFLTFDDLVERGFTNDDLWDDFSSVQELFSEVMYDASDELEIELDGSLHVQVYLMQAQGMHVTVTQINDTTNEDDDYIEMKVTLDESDELMFSFASFEDVIQVSSYLAPFGITGGTVYFYNGQYYYLLEETEFDQSQKEMIIALLSEYAYSSIITSHRLEEYGKVIYKDNAIGQIIKHFY
ncbi:genetic competence negative regulator [Oceanobacillus sp. CAU 1775]